MTDSVQARLTRSAPVYLEQEIVHMVAVESLVKDAPVDKVLANVRRRLEKMNFPMNGKPSDSRGLGEGHVEGD